MSSPRHRQSSSRRRSANRRTLVLEGLEKRVVLTQLQYGLFDTGVDANGNALPGGSTDTHYTMPVTQQGTAGQNAVVVSTLAGGWVANGSTHAWIAPIANEASSSTPSPGGTYEYETTFTVPSVGGGAQITGSLTGDDNIVAFRINGISTGYTRQSAYTGLVPFSVNGSVVAGVNTIDVVVTNNATGATGFHMENIGLNFLPTVAADNATENVVYGGTVTNTGTFADVDQNDTVTLSSSQGTVTQDGTNNGTFTFTQSNVTTSGTVTITATNQEGGTSTTTFAINAIAPSLTGGNTPIAVRSGGQAVAVDPNLTITDENGPNLTSASVSIGTNFTAAEDQLLFTAQNGITGAYNSATGILTLSGSATPAQYQAALRSVQYQDTNATLGAANLAPRTISFSIAPGTYNPANGHFYQFVKNSGITWTNAKAAADASSLFGLQGYLATLTSAAENTFAFSKTLSTGWIGASDAANPGDWEWADGPEAGLQFWSGIRNGTPVAGQYNDWNAGEPNDTGNVEFYAQYLKSGLWNDLANTSTVAGYLIEYGGSAGDPTLELTSQITANVSSVTDAPVVSTPTVAQGVNAPSATITGTADAGSLVSIYNDVNNNGTIDLGELVVGTEQLAADQTSYSIPVPLVQNAPNHFVVTALLAPASVSTPTVVPTITADSIPPVLPIVTTPLAAVALNTDTTTITGKAEAGSLVQIYADANRDGIVDDGDTVVGTEQLAPGQTSYSVTVPLVADAANNFLVTATDAAGNASAATVVPTVTADTTAPGLPIAGSPAAATSVNTMTYTVTGTAEAGSLVKVYADTNADGVIDNGEAVVGFLQLAPGQTSYSIVVPLIKNAANNFLVTATDAAGNASMPLVVPTITEDSTTPASPKVTSPTTALSVNAGATTITGTAAANSLVRIYKDFNHNGMIDIGDAVVGFEQLTGGATTYSITVPLTQESASAFLVTAANAAGTETAPVVVPTVTADSTPPGLPINGTLATTVNTATYSVTGTAEAGSLVKVYADTNVDGAIDNGEAVVGTLQLAPGQTSYSIAVPLAKNAANHFLVTATDGAGNVSATAVVPTITQDSTPPVLPIAGSPAAATTVNATTYTVTGTAEAGSLVKVYADANADGAIEAGEAVVGTLQLAPGQTSYSIVMPLAKNAANNFLVTATDVAGNASLPLVVPTITADSTPPVLPVKGSPAAATTVNTGTYTVTGTAEAGSLVKVYADANANGVIDNGEAVVGTLQLAPGQTSYSIAVPLTKNAANHFLVTATDAAGNASPPLVVPTITADSTAPVLPVKGSPAAATSVNTTTYTVTGTAEAGSLVKVYADANANGVIDNGEAVVGTLQLAPGQTSYSIAVPLAKNAANHFLVTATDAAGNASPPLVVPTITADSTTPVPPVAVNAPTGPTATTATTYTVTGTAEAGSLVKVYADANANGVIDNGEAVVGTLQLAPGQTSYSIAVPLTKNAANHFLVTATDAAGNASPPLVFPTINQQSYIQGTVFLDSNADGILDDGETGLAGRVVYLDLNHSGSFVAGDPTATTDAQGHFAFTSYNAGSATVAEDPTQDSNYRYVVDQTAKNADGTLAIAVVPFSAVNPLPVTFASATASTAAVSNTAYVQSLYRSVLGRTGTTAEVATWLAKMTAGMTAADVAAGFVNSLEHRTDQVATYYKEFLHRATDQGASHWVADLMSGASEQAVVEGILDSPEYQAAHASPNLYVRDLYLDVLGRQGTAAEVASSQAALASGTSMAALAARFVESAEANDQVVEAAYAAVLHRPRELGTSGVWQTMLQADASPSAVAIGILSSAEYRQEARVAATS